MTTYYKAVRLDKTSHYDQKTKWRKGAIIRPNAVDAGNNPCGHGIHCSPTLLDAVGYQDGPSVYCEVEPVKIVAQDDTKARCEAVKCIRWLSRDEQDEIAGFKLYEANHPVNPRLIKPKKIDCGNLLRDWSIVRASVGSSVGSSVRASVRNSVGSSVRDSVRNSVGKSVGNSMWASVWAYIGGLFPNITTWTYAESFGSDPWRPLLTLWYAGYLPSFDGRTWRLHCGPDAKVAHEWTPEEVR